MHRASSDRILLDVPLIEERYGRSFVISLGIHLAVPLLVLGIGYLIPRPKIMVIGTGPGGGAGGATYTVGIADELAGGAGMIKPSLIPQPPALPEDKKEVPEVKSEAIPLPLTVEKKSAVKSSETAKGKTETKLQQTSNVIPTAPQPGAGGSGGVSGGSGGGRGGGVGVSIGAGSGGLGDLYYIRLVESRIGSNWIRPAPEFGRVEIVYSFVIAADGSIRDIKKERSSGNEFLDLTAERAIRASDPLPPLPPELRDRTVQMISQFVYPPNP